MNTSTLLPNPGSVLIKPSLGALSLRVALGVMWLTHAIVLKVMTFGMAGLAAWMDSQGFAPVLAWPLVIAEVLGGTLILLGIHGRWASLFLQPVLIGALVVHAPNGWVFTSPNGGWEYPAFLMVASIAHFFIGDGPMAIKPERD
jgi:putative oxidoreductase